MTKPFFQNFKNFPNLNKNSESTLSITTQNANNDKYFKLYKINSELVNSEIDNLENTLDLPTQMTKFSLVLI